MSTKPKEISGLREKNFDHILFLKNNYYALTLWGLLNSKGLPASCSSGLYTGVDKKKIPPPGRLCLIGPQATGPEEHLAPLLQKEPSVWPKPKPGLISLYHAISLTFQEDGRWKIMPWYRESLAWPRHSRTQSHAKQLWGKAIPGWCTTVGRDRLYTAIKATGMHLGFNLRTIRSHRKVLTGELNDPIFIYKDISRRISEGEGNQEGKRQKGQRLLN